MKNNKIMKIVTIGIATLIATTSIPVNVMAMEGEVIESSEDLQESSNEESNEDTYNESVEEAMEAEEVAEETVETAEEACEVVESIADGNEEAGFEAVSAEDGGAVAQESVEAFAEAVENLNVAETVSEAAADLQAAEEELEVADEADRTADEKAVETVENVVAAQYVAEEATKKVAETKAQTDDLVEIITNADSSAEQVSEALEAYDKLTADAKEDIEIKKVIFESLCDKFENAKKELEGAQKVYEETVKSLKSTDGNVSKAAEKLEDAKKNVEVLAEACDNAKEDLEKEQAAVEDILAKKAISDKNKDWKTQDKLMESIISGYIIPTFIDKDATNITYTEMLRGFDRQNSSYTVVTYLDKDNNTVKRYFNIDRTDRQFKDNDQWYKLGSSREIVVYEKPEEDITSSVYQKNHFGNLSVTSQFKADVNSGKYDVYSFDYADGTNEYKCIDELKAGVESGEIELVDGVYYMNGTAARKIVQTTSGNAKGIRVSTKDDEGLKAFIENASKLVEKYEKYGENIADAQDKIEEASDKVEALEEAIDGIEEDGLRVAKVVTSDFVAGLRTYVSEADIERILAADSDEKAVEILEEILKSAKAELDDAEAELDELIEKREEIGRQIGQKEVEAEVETVEETVEVVEVAETAEVVEAEENEEAAEVNETENKSVIETIVAVIAQYFVNVEAPVVAIPEFVENIVADNTNENRTERASRSERANGGNASTVRQNTESTVSGDSDMIEQILGARRYNDNNNNNNKNVKLGKMNNGKSYTGVIVADDAGTLARDTEENNVEMNWWWIILLAILGITEKIRPIFS
ncbi:hypothetical protein [Butyrivibrio sp. LB2008]|uniref:hypothetical protein n=1 Tax=Butyrivibrio sp. LB2008 TaxID=1408305 RepID=UPI00047E7FDC|nr:hypothetical protein [Butyrivibrio sp. LB2008]